MKDFDDWNVSKKKVELRKRMTIKTGSVWICNFGLNIGYEIDGKNENYIRPALVLLGFGYSGAIVVPLTSSGKKSKFLITLNKKSSINLSQVRYLDSKRFMRYVFDIQKNKLSGILNALFKMFT